MGPVEVSTMNRAVVGPSTTQGPILKMDPLSGDEGKEWKGRNSPKVSYKEVKGHV